MKTQNTVRDGVALSADKSGDPARLASLLALAAGAMALPQDGLADIIFTAAPAHTTVSFGGVNLFIINNLPGAARVGFHATGGVRSRGGTLKTIKTATMSVRGGYVRFKQTLVTSQQVGQNIKWGTLAGAATARVFLATCSFTFGGGPPSYNNGYYAFEFQDSTQGNAPRYGWVELSLANQTFNAGDPIVTIQGWAYDTTGAQIAMGQTSPVPEPSSMALAALGAMAFGARGIRSWRGKRPAGAAGSAE